MLIIEIYNFFALFWCICFLIEYHILYIKDSILQSHICKFVTQEMKEYQFKSILDDIVSLRPTWDTQSCILKPSNHK